MEDGFIPLDGLLVRAGIYQALALGYAYPSTEQRDHAADMLDGMGPWTAAIGPKWPGRFAQLQEALSHVGLNEWEAEHNRLFSGAMPCAPLETAYEAESIRRQAVLADIAGFYGAFGFSLPEGSRWQPDHLGVELEFASILLQRMAYACKQNLTEQAEICEDALRKFLQDHLGRWASAICADLLHESALPLHACLASLTRAWVEAELAALGLKPDRLEERKRHTDDAEAPACGACTACAPQVQ